MKQILIRTEQIERSVDAKMDVEWRSENVTVTTSKVKKQNTAQKMRVTR